MVEAAQVLLFSLPLCACRSLSPVCLIAFYMVVLVWFITLSNGGVLGCRHCKEDENAEWFKSQK